MIIGDKNAKQSFCSEFAVKWFVSQMLKIFSQLIGEERLLRCSLFPNEIFILAKKLFILETLLAMTNELPCAAGLQAGLHVTFGFSRNDTATSYIIVFCPDDLEIEWSLIASLMQGADITH
jgi:hypothetical protein